MPLYRYLIKPLSAFATPLRSDTLYGHLLWRAAERFGADRVQQLIAAFSADQPPFKISSAFPHGCLPMPCLPPIARNRFRQIFAPEGGKALTEMLQKYKQFRKLTHIQADSLLSTGVNQEQLFRYWLKDPEAVASPDNWYRSAHQPHNSIDRSSGRVLTQGGLHFGQATWYASGTILDLYVETDQQALFEELFRDLQCSGYGADSSTGKGQFSFTLDPEFDAASWATDGNAHLLLSLSAADNMETLSGHWQTEIKRGRTWSGFGETNPFKKPFLAVKEGAVLTVMPESGYVLRNIHSNQDVVQVLWPLTLPLHVEEMS